MTKMSAENLVGAIVGTMVKATPERQLPVGIAGILPDLYAQAEQVDAGQVDKDEINALLGSLDHGDRMAWGLAIRQVRLEEELVEVLAGVAQREKAPATCDEEVSSD